MPDDYFARTQPPAPAPRKPAGIGRVIAAVGVLSFLLGGGLVGWLAYDGKSGLFGQAQSASQEGLTTPAIPRNPAAPPTLKSSATAGVLPNARPTGAAVATGLDLRMAQIERRLEAMDQRNQSASGSSARAENLLIAIAARRALERGMPLGVLEDQLRLRFGNAQPNAVKVVVEGARNPVTIDQLDAALTSFDAQLTSDDAGSTGWNKFKRQISNMFVIRRSDGTAARPEQPLEQARQLLRNGQPEAAANTIAAMPSHPAARNWIDEARRLAAIRQALDQLEATAILEPLGLPGSPDQTDWQSDQALDRAE